MNQEVPQTSRVYFTIVLNFALLKHFVYNELPLNVEEYLVGLATNSLFVSFVSLSFFLFVFVCLLLKNALIYALDTSHGSCRRMYFDRSLLILVLIILC